MNGRYKFVKKVVIPTIGVLAALWVVGCVGIYHVMRQPPETFARFMARMPGPVPFLVLPFETLWTHARAGHLAIGDPAPDFSLAKLDHSEQVRLSSFTAQKRPVVLVFGSYT